VSKDRRPGVLKFRGPDVALCRTRARTRTAAVSSPVDNRDSATRFLHSAGGISHAPRQRVQPIGECGVLEGAKCTAPRPASRFRTSAIAANAADIVTQHPGGTTPHRDTPSTQIGRPNQRTVEKDPHRGPVGGHSERRCPDQVSTHPVVDGAADGAPCAGVSIVPNG
jgi:hypothetical protein